LYFENTTKKGCINMNLIISDTMLPPHPDPLPRGEREVCMDLQGEGNSNNLLYSSRRVVLNFT